MDINFLIGVDGGGTGTRVLLARPDGTPLARASAGPSGLALGIAPAWQAIQTAIYSAFAQTGYPFNPARCAIGLGLAGVHNAGWAREFLAAAPVFGAIRLDNDGYTTLLGAHAGQPGAIIAIGTGIVGEAWFGAEEKRTVSGWGFPAGDEGSGAWIGLQAASLAQQALDGRAVRAALAEAVIAHWGGTPDSAFAWLGQARQTQFAQLAALVVEHAHDPAAARILQRAGAEIATVAQALDPQQRLPLALCGGLAEPLHASLPPVLHARCQAALGDACSGALHLIRQALPA